MTAANASATTGIARDEHYNFGYLDESTKRMLRRALLKAVPFPDLDRPLEFGILNLGGASDESNWAPAFRRPDAATALRHIELGEGHRVLANPNAEGNDDHLVGELHADAQVSRVFERALIAQAHDMGHHESNGAGDPIAIQQQLLQSAVARAAGIHCHTFNQLQGIVLRNAVAVYNILQRDKDRFPLPRRGKSGVSAIFKPLDALR